MRLNQEKQLFFWIWIFSAPLSGFLTQCDLFFKERLGEICWDFSLEFLDMNEECCSDGFLRISDLEPIF